MDNLAKDKTSKLLVKYSIPAIIAMLVTCLYNTADRAFIGSMEGVGAYAISGLGVTMPLFTLIGAFGVAVSVGGSTNISIKLGAKENEEAERLLGNTFALELLGGFVIMVLGLVFIDQILYAFGASAKTLPYAKDYMSIILLGAVVNLSGFSLNGAIRADGRPKLAATIMIVCSLLNLVFDPLFIFYFGFGIKGAAIGTVICQLINFIWTTYYFTKGNSNLKLRLKNIRLKKEAVIAILTISITPFCMEVVTGSIHLVTNKFLQGYGGDLAIGAMTTITSINLMFLMPIYGLSQGMQTLIAYNFGAKEYERVKEGINISLKLSVYISIIFIIILNIFAPYILRLFTHDLQVIKVGLESIRIVFPSYVFYAINQIYIGSLRGIEKTFEPMIIALFAHCIFRVVWCSVLLKYFHDMKVIYSSYSVSILIMFALLYFSYKKHICKKYFKQEVSNID